MYPDKYHELRRHVMVLLKSDAHLHEHERHESIGIGLSEINTTLAAFNEPRFSKLHVPVKFWDAWITARDVGWQEIEGIAIEAWPTLAKTILNDPEHDREISDSYIRTRFDLTSTQPYLKPIVGPLTAPPAWALSGTGMHESKGSDLESATVLSRRQRRNDPSPSACNCD